MLNRLIFSLGCFVASITVPCYAFDFEEENLEELTSYYEKNSINWVSPTVSISDDNSMSPLRPVDWFQTLDYKWIDRMESVDFLTATKRFYSQLPLSAKTQNYNIPFYTLKSWHSLPFAPKLRLTSSMGRYDARLFELPRINQNFTDASFQKELDDISDSELSFGNQLQLLPNNTSIRKKIELADQAKFTFWVNVMMFQCQSTTMPLAMAMAKAASRGVDVRIIVEGFHDLTGNGKCVRWFKKHGIKVVHTSRVLSSLVKEGVNHIKFWIKDGESGIIGGQNMHDSTNLGDGFNGYIRDTDLWIQSGPAVTDLEYQFTKLWNDKRPANVSSMDSQQFKIVAKLNEQRMNGKRGYDQYASILKSETFRSNGVCRIVIQRGHSKKKQISEAYLKLISASENSIQLESPSIAFNLKNDGYNGQIVQALAKQSKDLNATGFKIDVITNGPEGAGAGLRIEIEHSGEDIEEQKKMNPFVAWFDGWFQKSELKSIMKSLRSFLANNRDANIYQYINYIHSKMWFFDRQVVSIGSFNLDDFSSNRNDEGTAICMDHNLADQVNRQLLLDRINSSPVSF